MIVPEEYSRTITVAGYEVDAQEALRLSVLLRMCQETSDQHLTALGYSYEKLWRDGFVFLITTNRARIRHVPRHGDKLTIVTRPRGTAGVQFYRDFTFYRDGEEIVSVLQSSVSADPETHKPLRPRVFLDYCVFADEKFPQEERIEKLRVPEDLPCLGERPIRYSDLDSNQHLNNTVYADIAVDFLPGGMYGRRVAMAQINYINESTLGDSLRVSGGAREDGAVLLRGDNARGLGFSALLRLCDIKEK